ncbi:FAM10 family protein [Raphanus sativus]|uniref:FAM10 family protein At4g22670 n=1 Tax=Raphanus sativus TaxID=3726 RepID=A0A9W3BTD5_RAPSA|nr:FAM10 family protein At4g22670 [Raphanus sativus]XP_056842572.1 FAM10 family protein At4g22670 [Raphanus sativus]KAJ4917132.1 FAM10 family protein [Raphanus sativus]
MNASLIEEDEEQCLIVKLENVDLQGETVEPNCDPIHKERDLSDENREAAQELKGKAIDAVSEGKFYKAILHLTRAISMNPTSAILYGNRACVYIKLKNPKAAFRDAVTALKINPDSAKGYKARGIARAMFGEWAEAEKDLHLASMIDYDAEISDVLKEIEERRRQRSHAEAQAAYVKAKKQEQSSSAREKAKKGHSSSNRHRQEPRRQEQSSSSRQSRGSSPGSFPGTFPDGFLGGFPGSFPPGDDQRDQSGFFGSPFGSFHSFGSPFGYQN